MMVVGKTKGQDVAGEWKGLWNGRIGRTGSLWRCVGLCVKWEWKCHKWEVCVGVCLFNIEEREGRDSK